MAVNKSKAKNKKDARKFILILFLVVFIVPILITSIPYFEGIVGYNYITSEGSRVGQIYKLSYKGLIWKTWEAGMGLTQSGSYAETWQFSIDDQSPNKDRLVSEIQNAYQSGAIVRVQYKQHLGVLPWRSKTDYTIEDIQTEQSVRSTFIQAHFLPSQTTPAIDK